MTDTRTSCPKHMVHGPCGGVDPVGGCEVDRRPCPFTNQSWVQRLEADAADAIAEPPVHVPGWYRDGFMLVADVRADPDDPGSLGGAAERLRPVVDYGLVGEHLDDPQGTSPRATGAALSAAGLPCLVTVTARRDHDAAVEEMGRVVHDGAAAVHVVTGDHPAARELPVAAEFGTESMRMLQAARTASIPTTASESPASPPHPVRPRRVLQKQRAGAAVCILNHCGEVEDLVEFADEAASVGVTIPLVAPVPVVTDHRSAEALARFPGLRLPDSLIETVLAAEDPRAAGIEAAHAMAIRLRDSDRFAGVDLSGSGSGGALAERAAIMAEVATGLHPVGTDRAGREFG